MKRLAQWMLVIFGLLVSWSSSATMLWAPAGTGIPELDIRRVAPDPLEPSVLYVSSENKLYRSTDSGQTWKQALSLRGTSDAVNAVQITRQNGETVVYVATNQGVKASRDSGKTWTWFYQGSNSATRQVFCFLDERDGRLLLGTAQGLVEVNADRRKTILEAAPKAAIFSILEVEARPGIIFILTAVGVYHSTDWGVHWEKDLVDRTEKEEGGSLEQFDVEELSSRPVIPSLIYFASEQKVYAANGTGLFESALEPVSWKASQGQGLAGHAIRCLVQTGKAFYAGTESGVFRWNPEKHFLEDVSNGLETGPVETLVYSRSEDALYAAGRRGLFKMSHPDLFFGVAGGLSAPDAEHLLRRFQNEPGIRDVQQAAIRYAEVSPEKIKAWREAAAKKALLPTLSVRSDSRTDDNVDIDRGGTADADRFIIGPKEKSFDWSVGLSWDLGDMIWNDDQTSIDTRSKLMVELRGDLLNEVTHLYYERRRLQIEMAMSPAPSVPVQIEKTMRLEELTAGIDALTGAYLSKNLDQAMEKGV